MDDAKIVVPLRPSDGDAAGFLRQNVCLTIAETARARWLNHLLRADDALQAHLMRTIRITYCDALAVEERSVACTFLVTHVTRDEVELTEVMTSPDGRVVAELNTRLAGWDPLARKTRPLTEPAYKAFVTAMTPEGPSGH